MGGSAPGTVTVRLFAVLRERAGSDSVQVQVAAGDRVADVLERLAGLTDGIDCVLAVNRDYARPEDPVAPGDEVALVPPVSGGAGGEDVWVALRDGPLDPAAVSARVVRPAAGGVVTFQGITREVDRLDYEAYPEMAVERMRAIASEVLAEHGACAVAVEHRTGTVPLSEPSVVAAASGPHREEAFSAARALIDRIKAEAPIWKREEGEWVKGTTPGR